MKTRTKWLIGAVVLTLAIGGYAMKELVFGFGDEVFEKKPTKEEKQLAYLKEHEQEIVDFVKAQNPKIESVQIDWEDVRRFDSSNPFGDNVSYISIFGGFNHIEDSGWNVVMRIEGDKVDLETIGMRNDLYIGGELFE